MTDRAPRSMKALSKSIAGAGHVYTQANCGCLIVVAYDIPWVLKDMKEDIVKEALAGRAFKHCKQGELPPLNCPTHEAEYQARKVVREAAEVGLFSN